MSVYLIDFPTHLTVQKYAFYFNLACCLLIILKYTMDLKGEFTFFYYFCNMMEANDTYKTVESLSEGQYSEKRSKFLAFAIPVESEEQAKEYVKSYTKKYYDARHCCYAYMLGAERKVFRANDNGEPSGTAGKPILGQINSLELTDVLVIVVRYFGGVKLGTSGLIVAYRHAAREALESGHIVERIIEEEVSFGFEYPFMNSVMRIVKETGAVIKSSSYDSDCGMTLAIRASMMPMLKDRLKQVETLYFT